MKFFSLVLLMFASVVTSITMAPAAAAQSPETDDYAIYSAEGSVLTWEDVRQKLSRYEVVLVGEIHDDSIGHMLEFDLLKTLHSDPVRSEVALSLEMFDQDVQYIVDEYLNGYISESHFTKSSRPWDNYEADYRPMVEFAKENGLSVVAANAPRRYVNKVSRSGPESLQRLPESAREYLPPLPVDPPSEMYREKWNALMAEAMGAMTADSTAKPVESDNTEDHDAVETNEENEPDTAYAAHGGFNMEWMLDAQNVWDAGMAYAIARHLTDNPGGSLIHYVGSFHVESGSGIPDHLIRYRPSARIAIVNISPVEDPTTFDEELRGSGDIIFQTREKK